MKKRYIVDDEKLLSKWNFKKNHLTPDQITTGSGKKVWWICDKEHDYEAKVMNGKLVLVHERGKTVLAVLIVLVKELQSARMI